MTNRSDAFASAEQAAINKNSLTEKRWAIQHAMEIQGFKFDSSKGTEDEESAYSAMKVDIYQSHVAPSKFLSVESGVSVAGIKVPDTDYVKVKLFKSKVDLTSGVVALIPGTALAAIQKDGFYLHSATTV